jgi:hypothetical protein
MSDELDPTEALRHIKTLARVAQDSPDEATTQKYFGDDRRAGR